MKYSKILIIEISGKSKANLKEIEKRIPKECVVKMGEKYGVSGKGYKLEKEIVPRSWWDNKEWKLVLKLRLPEIRDSLSKR